MPLEVIETEDNIDYKFDILNFANRMDTMCDNLSDDDNVNTSDFVINVIKSYGVTDTKIPRTLLNKMAHDLATKKDEWPTIVIYTIDFSLSFIMLAMIKKNNTSPDVDTGNLVPHMNECWTNIVNLLRSVADNPDDDNI